MTAECSAEYFDRIGLKHDKFDKEDKCIYTVYHHVKIWRAAAINVKAFGVIGVIILLLGLGILIWWLCSFVDLNRLKAQLQQYQSVGQDNQMSETDHRRPDETIEMKEVAAPNVEQQGGHVVLNEEVDLPHDLHDIE